jgi:protein-disulfide isomerase
VFKHQPLPFHDKAMGAALAVAAANRQKKGWAMHDKCFENNTALTRDDLDKYAKDIGLDMTKFKKDMDDPGLKQQVEADSKIANSVGASGTPTFFINGRILVGAQPFEKFEEVIKEEIKQADALIASGTPKSEVYKKRSTSP